MPRVLLYSHDTFGLGHLRRSLKLADALGVKLGQVEGLLVTGSPWARLFTPPPGFSFVQLPPVVKQGACRYRPRLPGLSLDAVLGQRNKMILEAVAAFGPDLMIVDNVPCGLGGEILPALQTLKAAGRARLVLSLRDILDRADAIRAQWDAEGADEPLCDLYDEIWVFGHPDTLDPRAAYGMRPAAADKIVFCGYLQTGLKAGFRAHAAAAAGEPAAASKRAPGNGSGPMLPPNGRAFHGPGKAHTRRPSVLVTGGGGGDAESIVTTYLSMLRQSRLPVDSLIVLGPDYPGTGPARLDRPTDLDVRIASFVSDLPAMIARADVVISMAGYNTVCEILEARRRAVLIPRVRPREEQRLRAEAFAGRRGLVVMDPAALTPAGLRDALETALAAPEPEPMRLTGGNVAAERAAALLGMHDD